MTSRISSLMLSFIVVHFLVACGGSSSSDRDNLVGPGGETPTIYRASGTEDTAAAQSALRAALGTNNGGAPGLMPDGFRPINWDAAPDAVTNNVPGGSFDGAFFDFTSAPRARGIRFELPEGGLFDLRDDNFLGLNPNYDGFQAFSEPKTFAVLGGTNVYDITFSVAGSPGTGSIGGTRAATNAVGLVFTSVDVDGSAQIEIFDVNNNSLGTLDVPAGVPHSFVGLLYPSRVIGRVRVFQCAAPLGANELDAADGGTDKCIIDDVTVGEPS